MNWMDLIKRGWNVGNDVQQKGWYASKTVWFNILSFLAAIAAIKGFDLPADDVQAIAGGVVTVVNIFLRFNSDTPVGLRKVDGEQEVGLADLRTPPSSDVSGGNHPG